MAEHGKPIAVQLGPDLFLDQAGKFTKSKPLDSLIAIPSSGVLNLPDEVKNFLNGKQLADVRDNGIVKAVEDLIGVSDKAREFAKDVFQIATSLASMIGYVQAAVKILQMLGVFGPDETQAALKRIEKRVEEIFNLAFGAAQDAKVVAVRGQLSEVRAAGAELIDVLKYGANPPADARARLFSALARARVAHNNLLAADFQNMPFRWAQYGGRPWLYGSWWVVRSSHAPAGTPVPDLRTLSDGAYKFDYRLFLPAIIESVTTSLGLYKAIDPAFRTTGRFREELQAMAADLAVFANSMIACIQWTRDYDLFSDHYYTPMAYGYPVGAVDICTGSNSLETNWKEGVVSFPAAQGSMEPPMVLNVQDTIDRGHLERERAWFSVFASSAIPEILQLQRRVAELSSPPVVSETVAITTRRSGTRTFVNSEPYKVDPTLGCDGATFTADIYEVQRTWKHTVTLQPAYYADQYAIPYHFYIEALSTGDDPVQYDWAVVSRGELVGASGTVTLQQVRKYEWMVRKLPIVSPFKPGKYTQLTRLAAGAQPMLLMRAPGSYVVNLELDGIADLIGMDAADNAGQVRNQTWGTINIDYTVTRVDGKATITLKNRPSEGNFANVFLVVEETPRPIPGPIPPVRTAVNVSTVGREHHMPQEYFDYIEECQRRLAQVLDYLGHYLHQREPGGPVPPEPPWERATYQDVEQYLADVNRLDPRAIPREMLTRSALRRIRQLPPRVTEVAPMAVRSARGARAPRRSQASARVAAALTRPSPPRPRSRESEPEAEGPAGGGAARAPAPSAPAPSRDGRPGRGRGRAGSPRQPRRVLRPRPSGAGGPGRRGRGRSPCKAA